MAGALVDASRVGPSQLSFSATVARAMVHRAAVCEVFLTDSVRTGPDTFLVGAQLPRVHSYHNDWLLVPSEYDPLLLAEVCRQAAVLLTHEYFDVALSQKFVLNHSNLRVVDRSVLRVGQTPGKAVVEVTVTDRKFRGPELVGISCTMRVVIREGPAVTVDIAIQWMPGSAWDKLRERGRAGLARPGQVWPRPRATEPSAVGRRHPANVVIGALRAVKFGDYAAEVVVDQSHASLFDHPVDHIPGVLLQEAARQTAIAAAHEHLGFAPQRLAVDHCLVDFRRFGEFELPTVCHAHPPVLDPGGGSLHTRISVSQEGEEIVTARVGLTLVCGAW